jgi:predicted Zn-dependent peptidase
VLHLQNGFTILLVASGDPNEIALDFATRNAAEAGNPLTAGIASLAGLLLSDADNSARPASIVEERGLQFQPRISRDGGDFLLTSTPQDLESTVQHLLTALTHPVCQEQTFERLREKYVNYLIRNASNPEQAGVNLVRRRLYGEEHPLGQPPEGTRAIIDSATLKDVWSYCSDRVRPRDSALVIVASSLPKDELAFIEKELGRWGPGAAASTPPPATAPPATASQNPIEVLPWYGGEQSWLVLGAPGPPRTAPEYSAFLVIANLVRDRLTTLREKPAARAWVDASGVGTTLFITEPVPPSEAGKAVQALLHEIETLAAKPIAEEELAVAQSRVASSIGDAYATATDTAITVGALFDGQLPYDTETTLVTRVQALTPDDIRHAAQLTLQRGQRRLVVVGEPIRALSSLRAAGFDLKESPASHAAQ